jgi:2-aminobenzoate-CoA ligase
LSEYSAHTDTFAHDNLPPKDQWPKFIFESPELQYPEKLNCATQLLDKKVEAGLGDKIFMYTPNETWTYKQLLEKSNQIAHVLVDDLGLEPGNRVLIRAANNPMFVACWYAVAKAGGIVVATMPMLRAKELCTIIDKAQVKFSLCDERLQDEMASALGDSPICERCIYFNGSGETGAGAELEELMDSKSTEFQNVETARDDTVLIAFTSGTTGTPKAAMHFHRDIMAMCHTYSNTILRPNQDDIFIGSPPIAFTFGLGGLVTFPMCVGASVVLLEMGSPDKFAKAIQDFKATICFTSPTAYRMMLNKQDEYDLSSLKKCVSAGETLPLPTYEAWLEATGIKIMDGIGTTEMIHIFISAVEEDIRPGSTGKAVPGYEAMVVDENMQPLSAGEVGRLAVRGATGCRYLADERQKEYAIDGWNITGDAYKVDEDGYFWFQARHDDMIISSGYNISGPEVEEALLDHEAVQECAVVGSPDDERGNLVKAFVVLRDGFTQSDEVVRELQDFVKNSIAPYKYPRAIDFIDSLPKTETGKVQRFKLRQQELRK